MFVNSKPFFYNNQKKKMEAKIQLQNIKISDYIKMLKLGEEKELLILINDELLKQTSNFKSENFDISLFLLQKDLLILQCRYAIAVFDFDETKQKMYLKKIDELREQIESKTKSKEKKEVNPYNSFLEWILSVEKYLGFSIDKENDLLYFVTATTQMLNYFNSQTKQLEKTTQKK